MATNTADAKPVAPSRLIPPRAMRCARCGMTVHPAAAQHDQALLLASCCPRCDGPLVPHDARPSNRRATPWADVAPTTD